MISQGAMALGGVVWGSACAIAGTSHTLLGAAALFLMSLLLSHRLSINFAGNLEERVSGVLSVRVEPKEGTPIARKRGIARSLNDSEKNYEQQTSRKWSTDGSADSHSARLKLRRNPSFRLARAGRPGSHPFEHISGNHLADGCAFLMNGSNRSMGIGKNVVVLCSLAISFIVCK
jgi:hypothetical protein